MPTDTSTLVEQLRRLQHAANMLNYHQFCAATGARGRLPKAKFIEFQKLDGCTSLTTTC
jgi:hypothetical protein